jgi:hypothetical protein
MKKLLPALLLGLLFSSPTQAITFSNVFTGTLFSWQNLAGSTFTDILADPLPEGADTSFTLLGTTGLSTLQRQFMTINVQEIHNSPLHSDILYDLILTPNITDPASPFFGIGYIGGLASFNYSITSIQRDLLSSIRLDSDTAAAGLVERVDLRLSDTSILNPPFLALISLNGEPVPVSPPGSHLQFSPRKEIFVSDIFNSNGGLIHSISNQFNVIPIPVPEPEILLLLGIGLVVLILSRKNIITSSSLV